MKNVSGIAAIVAVVSMLLLGIGFPYWTADTVTITVTDKERVVKRNGNSVSSKYLVFTETETFENTDCLARFKFNSSDVQGRLKTGETYTVDVYGWRIPFLSAYRNIVRVRQIPNMEFSGAQRSGASDATHG